MVAGIWGFLLHGTAASSFCDTEGWQVKALSLLPIHPPPLILPSPSKFSYITWVRTHGVTDCRIKSVCFAVVQTFSPPKSLQHRELPLSDLLSWLYTNINWQLNWQIVWRDEFNGEELDTNLWTVRNDNELGCCRSAYCSPKNVNLRDGKLVLTSNREAYNDHGSGKVFNYTTGSVISQGKSSWSVGSDGPYRVCVSAQLPGDRSHGKGIWPAHWLLPDYTNSTAKQCWPDEGEVDIMEMIVRCLFDFLFVFSISITYFFGLYDPYYRMWMDSYTVPITGWAITHNRNVRTPQVTCRQAMHSKCRLTLTWRFMNSQLRSLLLG